MKSKEKKLTDYIISHDPQQHFQHLALAGQETIRM